MVDGEPELSNSFEVARAYRFKKGSGFPVSVPSVDLVEIGPSADDLVDLFAVIGLETSPGTPEALGQRTAAETLKWAKAIKEAGIPQE